MFKCSTVMFAVLLTTMVQASEVDSFTDRYEWGLEDASEIIHEKAHEFFELAIDQANQKSRGCHEKTLYRSLRKYFKNHISGELVPFILNSPDISKTKTSFTDSIYQDFKWYEAFSLAAIRRIYTHSSAYMIRMGDVHIGSDKFEHLFGRGFRYFEKYYLKEQPLESVLKFGHRSERIFLGAKTTGVYSYGDLAANFNGMRFWNDVLSKNADILTGEQGFGPYIICEEDKWVLNKKVNFNNYIDYSWDEATNCSKLRTKKLLNKVLASIDRLEEQSGLPHHCPFVKTNLSMLTDKYGPTIAPWILNFEGHGSLK